MRVSKLMCLMLGLFGCEASHGPVTAGSRAQPTVVVDGSANQPAEQDASHDLAALSSRFGGDAIDDQVVLMPAGADASGWDRGFALATLACKPLGQRWQAGSACAGLLRAGMPIHRESGSTIELQEVSATEAVARTPRDDEIRGMIFSTRPARAQRCEITAAPAPDPRLTEQVRAHLSATIPHCTTHPYECFDQREATVLDGSCSWCGQLDADLDANGQPERIAAFRATSAKDPDGVGLSVMVIYDNGDAKKSRVALVNTHGQISLQNTFCGDFDGDGLTELVIGWNGECERYYTLATWDGGQLRSLGSVDHGD